MVRGCFSDDEYPIEPPGMGKCRVPEYLPSPPCQHWKITFHCYWLHLKSRSVLKLISRMGRLSHKSVLNRQLFPNQTCLHENHEWRSFFTDQLFKSNKPKDQRYGLGSFCGKALLYPFRFGIARKSNAFKRRDHDRHYHHMPPLSQKKNFHWKPPHQRSRSVSLQHIRSTRQIPTSPHL